MYKVTFGLLGDGNRGIEYASQVNEDVIKGLWGHAGTEVTRCGCDDNGNFLYHLTDNQIRVNAMLVTAEHIAE